jgi:hypothetical protein
LESIGIKPEDENQPEIKEVSFQVVSSIQKNVTEQVLVDCATE